MQADDSIKKFLTALHEAETAGRSTEIHKIGFSDVETALSVFKRCKGRFLVMGEPQSAWITPLGRAVLRGQTSE